MLILIEWSKVQYIKKWIILVIRLMKYEDFCTKCLYVFDISKIVILGKGHESFLATSPFTEPMPRGFVIIIEGERSKT